MLGSGVFALKLAEKAAYLPVRTVPGSNIKDAGFKSGVPLKYVERHRGVTQGQQLAVFVRHYGRRRMMNNGTDVAGAEPWMV